MAILTQTLKLLDILQECDYVYSGKELSKALGVSERHGMEVTLS